MSSFSETRSRICEHYVQEDPDPETLQFTVETSEEEEDGNTPIGLFRIDDEEEDSCLKNNPNREKKIKNRNQVFLEGYVESANEDDLTRTKSLTDEDLEELKGCLDLGFGFSYEEIPELCNTLPALELCYSMNQRYLDEQQKSPEIETCSSASSGPIANWKISSPGDHPEDVKARLKYWAQAVACTVRLCS